MVVHLRNSRNQVMVSEVEPANIEAILNKWLNLNLDKQKTGTFVPISSLKWCISSSGVENEQKMFIRSNNVHFDFFVASALNSIDNLYAYWLQKMSQDSILKNKKLCILLQKFSSVKEDAQWMVRMHWRKSRGFRIYKYKQLSHLNSMDTLNYQLLSGLFDNQISTLSDN